MNAAPGDKRVDPLIDAYRQASELDAQTSGARPSVTVRAAVLAHARVVAQSTRSGAPDESKLAVSEAVRATPAANESKPVWRMMAGVVLGLAFMWVYQLTRSGTTGEANVAVLSAPQSAKSAAAAVEMTATTTSPTVVSSKPAPAQPETTVAVAAPAGRAPDGAPAAPAAATVQAMRTAPLRERADSSARAGAANSPPVVIGGAGHDTLADAARSEVSVVTSKVATPLKKAESPAQMAAPNPSVATTAVATAAPTKAIGAATSAMPEAATSEPMGEITVASAGTRKLARAAEAGAPAAAATAPAAAPEAPALATAPPANAFPATASGVIVQSAPPAAAPAASPSPAFATRGNAEMRRGAGSVGAAPDAAMFSAIRLGNINALRTAIARGANVNARDEAGRSALQIARERNDAEMMKALDLAGAK